jgi:hypothetical protein
VSPALAAAGPYGPGPEGFAPVGRFVFRNEAEAVARKVAATRGMSEPVNVVEVHVESTSMTPGGRGWSVVVVGKIPGGCHAVTVGLAADTGRIYAIADRRATPAKAPPDCERWFIEGGAESASATLDTAPIAAPPPVAAKAPKGARTLSREDVLTIATEQAMKKGYTETAVKLAEMRPGGSVDGRDETPSVWRADLVGKTPKGCGIYKLELTGPDWKMRFQNNQMSGRKVQVEECHAWYERDGKEESPSDWLPGKVEWTVVDSDNLQ